ncbi:MAG: hypothetical protein COA49_02585, partial [Bacteroidetes bacterium]
MFTPYHTAKIHFISWQFSDNSIGRIIRFGAYLLVVIIRFFFMKIKLSASLRLVFFGAVIASKFLIISCSAQTDTSGIETLKLVEISEAVVSSGPTLLKLSESPRSISIINSKEIIQSGATSISEVLEYVFGVDLRQRGLLGVQSDLSVRGGSFEQTALVINGVRISAPQTGHHLMNLGFDPEDVTKIEVVRGGSSPFIGTGAMSGAIQFITGPSSTDGALVSFESGSFGWLRAKARVDFGSDNFRHRISLSRATTTGYKENTDAKMNLASYYSAWKGDAGSIKYQLTMSAKAFGAQDFYTTYYPTQY